MRFMLHYRGPLKANGGVEHKHEIRQNFHAQLARLWVQPPLSDWAPHVLAPRGPAQSDYCLRRPSAAFTFVPLVTQEMNVVASLTITLLRPEPAGNLITKGGDIDNRVKTLFDALTMPPQDQLPKGAVPSADQQPFFYCVLEEDALVTAVSVRTEQLLEPVAASVADLTIDVKTEVTRPTMSNSLFA